MTPDLPEFTDDEIEEMMDGHKMPWIQVTTLWHQQDLIIESFLQHVINVTLQEHLSDDFFEFNKNIEDTIQKLGENMRTKYRPRVIAILKRHDVDRAMAGE